MKKLLLCAFIVLSLCGCVRTTYTGSVTKFPERTKFEIIRDANLKLEVVGKRELISGIDDSITLRLTNVGGNAIRIEEWYMKEVDNFVVYYQPWKPGAVAPDPTGWYALTPVLLDRPRRYPLDMSPGVSVLVRFGLPFLDGMKVTPGKERRFFMKAELSLRSVRAETNIFAISVL